MTGTPRILFVDDEANILRALERIFLDDDYEVMTASSGEEGLAILGREPGVRVVVSDYRMPGMDGIAFLREVGDRWPDTVRLVLSGYADTASVASAVNEGKVARFIAKPWHEETLRQAVTDALRQHRRNVRSGERERELRHVLDILDQLPFGVLAAGRDGAIRLENRTAVALLGDRPPRSRVSALPPALAAVMTRALDASEAAGAACFSGRRVRVRGFRVVRRGREEVVFLLEPDARVAGFPSILGGEAAGTPAAPPPAKPKILCVDDEPEILRLMAKLLEADYEVMTARTGAEGLETLGRSPGGRVVLADYRMPGMDGIEFLRHVADRWPDTVRIVISGHADVASVVAAINEGRISRFIAKPWDPDSLRAAIDEALSRYACDMRDRNVRERLDDLLEILEQLPIGILAAGADGGILFGNRMAETLIGRAGMLPPPLGEFLARTLASPHASETLQLSGREIRADGYRALHGGRPEALFLLEEVGRG